MANPDISKATEALDRLSQNPEARRLAQWREDELRLRQVEIVTAERRGLEQGLKRQRALVRRLLEQRFGPLGELAQTRLDKDDYEAIEQYADRVLSAQSLSDVLGDLESGER